MLPPLPDGITSLECDGCSKLLALPSLPNSILLLNCDGCENLTELPPLPENLSLTCSNCINLQIQRIDGESCAAYGIRWDEWRAALRTSIFKEELIVMAFHPERIRKWLEIGGIELVENIIE